MAEIFELKSSEEPSLVLKLENASPGIPYLETIRRIKQRVRIAMDVKTLKELGTKEILPFLRAEERSNAETVLNVKNPSIDRLKKSLLSYLTTVETQEKDKIRSREPLWEAVESDLLKWTRFREIAPLLEAESRPDLAQASKRLAVLEKLETLEGVEGIVEIPADSPEMADIKTKKETGILTEQEAEKKIARLRRIRRIQQLQKLEADGFYGENGKEHGSIKPLQALSQQEMEKMIKIHAPRGTAGMEVIKKFHKRLEQAQAREKERDGHFVEVDLKGILTQHQIDLSEIKNPEDKEESEEAPIKNLRKELKAYFGRGNKPSLKRFKDIFFRYNIDLKSQAEVLEKDLRIHFLEISIEELRNLMHSLVDRHLLPRASDGIPRLGKISEEERGRISVIFRRFFSREENWGINPGIKALYEKCLEGVSRGRPTFSPDKKQKAAEEMALGLLIQNQNPGISTDDFEIARIFFLRNMLKKLSLREMTQKTIDKTLDPKDNDVLKKFILENETWQSEPSTRALIDEYSDNPASVTKNDFSAGVRAGYNWLYEALAQNSNPGLNVQKFAEARVFFNALHLEWAREKFLMLTAKILVDREKIKPDPTTRTGAEHRGEGSPVAGEEIVLH